MAERQRVADQVHHHEEQRSVHGARHARAAVRSDPVRERRDPAAVPVDPQDVEGDQPRREHRGDAGHGAEPREELSPRHAVDEEVSEVHRQHEDREVVRVQAEAGHHGVSRPSPRRPLLERAEQRREGREGHEQQQRIHPGLVRVPHPERRGGAHRGGEHGRARSDDPLAHHVDERDRGGAEQHGRDPDDPLRGAEQLDPEVQDRVVQVHVDVRRHHVVPQPEQ